MIRNLYELVRELLHAASVALCPCGEHVPTTAVERPEPLLYCTPYCQAPCSDACDTAARAAAAL